MKAAVLGLAGLAFLAAGGDPAGGHGWPPGMGPTLFTAWDTLSAPGVTGRFSTLGMTVREVLAASLW